jgi:hypothetical protein
MLTLPAKTLEYRISLNSRKLTVTTALVFYSCIINRQNRPVDKGIHAMITHKKAKTMSRAELVREESKRAAEYGQTPKRAISLAPRFRVERRVLTSFPASSTMIPTGEVARRNDADFQIGPTTSTLRRAALGIPAAGALDPKVLSEVIAANARRLTPQNRAEIVPQLLSQIGALAAQAKDGKRIVAVRQKISKTMFGAVKFRNIRGKKGGGVSGGS